jgi:hypothetical protein
MMFTSGSYSGNGGGSNISITIGFQPDAVIIKASTAQHTVMRTATMPSNATKQLAALNALQANHIVSLDANGFTVGTQAEVNGGSANTYYWMAFKDTGDGDLNIGSYSGNSTAGRQITTGFQPSYVIVMSSAGVRAVQRFSTMADNSSIQFDTSSSALNMITGFGPTFFTLGSDTQVNGSSSTTYHYIAWKAVTGRSQVGSYTGDGSTGGQAIAGLGFRPEYVIVKGDSNNVGVHHPVSLNGDNTLRFDNNGASGSITDSIKSLDADGFHVGGDATVNGNGTTYYWMAFDADNDVSQIAITSPTSVDGLVAGSSFPVVVQAQDSTGSPINVAVPLLITLSLKTGSGVLGGTVGGVIPIGSSQITLAGVTYTRAEGGVVITASAPGESTPAAFSQNLTFAAGSGARLVFSTPPRNSIAGTITPGPPTVTVEDIAGNLITNSTASITISLNTPGVTLNGTKIQNAASGSAAFTDLSINTAGTGYSFTASSPGFASATSATFNVNAGPPVNIVLAIPPVAIGVPVGTPLRGPTTVAVRDSFGNNVVSPPVPIAVQVTGPSVLNGTTLRNTVGGSAIFSDIYVTKTGNYTLTATAPGLPPVSSGQFSVNVPGAATRLAFPNPIANATAGAAIPAFKVCFFDAFNNTVTVAANISIAIGSNPGGANLSGTTTVQMPGGCPLNGFISGLVIDRANPPNTTYTFIATATDLSTGQQLFTPAVSSNFNINKPTGKDLVIEGLVVSPGSVQFDSGTNVSVSYSVANRGTLAIGASEQFTDKIYLSTDAVLGSDVLLGTSTQHGAGLASNGTIPVTQVVTIPNGTAIGNYYVLVVADDPGVVTEVLENNNLATKPFAITGPSPFISNLSPSSGQAGTVVTISGSNFGTAQGNSTITFNGVNAVPNNWSDTSIDVPVPAAATTGPVVVTVSGQASNSATFTLVNMPDLAVSALSTPPTSATAGTSFTVTDTTINNGNAPAAATVTRYRLSLDTTITSSDPLLIGTRSIPVLAPGEMSTGSVTVTVPVDLPPGLYFIAACADDTQLAAESNETNNCLITSAPAQLKNVKDKGLAWLITHQQLDGSWRSTAGTEVTATATALEVFGNAGMRNAPNYGRGISWLSNASASSVDSLVRQIWALNQAQLNVGVYLSQLLGWRNDTLKTWGAYKKFETSFPDTPLALNAIRTAALPYLDGDVQTGVCVIMQAQKTGDPSVNGSWSYVPSLTLSPSTAVGSAILPTTANISEVAAIQKLKGWTTRTCNSVVFTLQTVIDNGINWFLTQRAKPDGGFGDGNASTVLDTALAYPVLLALRPTDPATSAALSYLINHQNDDGSWNSDALQTAFALKALGNSSQLDTDNDGIPDTVEILLGTNPNGPDPRNRGNQGMSMMTAQGLSSSSLSTMNQTNTSSGLIADGDLNGDDTLDAGDLALAERFALGLAPPTAQQLIHGDVFPPGSPDGVIDVNDVASIRRKILGLGGF